jgi:uncharacterized membrane protein YkvA (DUF1232 family)
MRGACGNAPTASGAGVSGSCCQFSVPFSRYSCNSFTMRYLTKFQLFTLVLAGLYIVSPIDFIPEIIAGPFGLVDDAAAFAVIIALLAGARSKASTERNYQSYVRVDPETGNVI